MEFTIRDVVVRFWQERIIVVLTTIVLLAGVLVAILTMTPRYSATLIVAPVESTLDPSRTPAGAIGGITQLLSGSEHVTPFQIYLRFYRSTELAAAMIHDHAADKLLFADRWDAITGTWHGGSLPGRLLALASGPPRAPTANDVSDYLKRNISLDPGEGEDMQTVTVLYPDKAVAGELLQWVHDEAENLSKRRIMLRAQSNIDYLTERLRTTTQNEQRNALISLLLSQENMLMAAQSWNAYAGDIISGPWVSDRPVSPNPPLLIAMALLGGIIIGCGISFVRMLMGMPVVRRIPRTFKLTRGRQI